MPGLTDWDGRLHVNGEEAAWAIQNAEALRLRITRESGIYLGDEGDLAAGELQIKGNGPVPFD